MKYDFEKDLSLSQTYERKFGEWLQSKGMTDIKYAPTDESFHDWDIKTEHDTYEIKYDRIFNRTGNVLIETQSTIDNSLGWFYKTKANWLIVFFNENEFYGCRMEDLRDSWFNRWKLWRSVVVQTDTGRKTICFIAPIKDLPSIKYGDIRK